MGYVLLLSDRQDAIHQGRRIALTESVQAARKQGRRKIREEVQPSEEAESTYQEKKRPAVLERPARAIFPS